MSIRSRYSLGDGDGDDEGLDGLWWLWAANAGGRMSEGAVRGSEHGHLSGRERCLLSQRKQLTHQFRLPSLFLPIR
jgi:hypothetical protein